MKKKLVAFAVTAAMLVTSAVPAFALTNWGATAIEGNVVTVDSKAPVPSSEVAYTFTGNETTTFETVVDFNYDLQQGNTLDFTLNYVDADGVNQSVVLKARDAGTDYVLYFDGEDSGDSADYIEHLNGVCTLEWTVSKDDVKVRVIEHADGEDYVVNTVNTKLDYVALSLAPAASKLTTLTAKTTAGVIAIYKAYPEKLESVDVSKLVDGEYVKIDQPSYGDHLYVTALNLSNDTVITGEDMYRYVVDIQWMRDGVLAGNGYDYPITDDDRGARITAKVILKSDCGIFKEYTWGTATDRIAEFDRFAGANRYETAINIAEAYRNGGKFDAVVVAYGDDYADALSATALADKYDAPILLVNANNEDYVGDYILKNLKNTNSTVYFVGGEGVISKDFENKFYKYHKVRFAGDDRYDTNMMVLKNLGISSTTVMICSAADYPDALSVAATGMPILLVGQTLTDVQKDFLKDNVSATNFMAIGGNAVVGSDVVNFIAAHYDADKTIQRLYGDNRYETNDKVAKEFFTGTDKVIVASGDSFADALTAAAYAANISDSGEACPVILVNDYNYNRAANFINDDTYLMVAGGEGVISNELVQKIA